MGAFDDLIPQAGEGQAGTFDDLIPQAQPVQPEQAAPEDIFEGLPSDVVSVIEERHPFRLTKPTATGGLGVLPQRNIQEGQAKEAVLGDRRKAADFERLRIRNPFLAESIEDLSEVDKAAIGFQTGLRTVARGTTGLLGIDTFKQDDSEKESLKELGKVSGTFKATKIAGEAAPFLAAAPLAGAGLTTSVAGRALIPAARTLTSRAAGSAALGAGEGAAIAKGEGKEGLDVVKAGVISGVLGFGSEVAAPLVRSLGDVRKLAKDGRKLLKEPTQKEIAKGLQAATPSVKDLKQASRKIYKSVEDLGVGIKPESMDNLLNNILIDAKKLGFKDTVAVKEQVKESVGIINIIKETQKQDKIGVDDLEAIRRFSQDAESRAIGLNAKPNQDSAIADSIVDNIDDFLTNITSKDIGGNLKNVGGELATARKLWGRARRSELLEQAVDLSSLQASGLENGIRIKFKQILASEKKKRFFSSEELDAMLQVVEGTKGGNFFKRLSKTGFGRGQQTNVLGGVAATSAATVILGPIFGVLLAGAGKISAGLAERLTIKNAAMANQIVRAGANAEQITKVYLRNTPKSDRSADELSQLLMRSDVKLETASSSLAKEAAKLAKKRRLTLVPAAVPLQAAATEEDK